MGCCGSKEKNKVGQEPGKRRLDDDDGIEKVRKGGRGGGGGGGQKETKRRPPLKPEDTPWRRVKEEKPPGRENHFHQAFFKFDPLMTICNLNAKN